jgi:hypothetical protein
MGRFWSTGPKKESPTEEERGRGSVR